MKGEQAEAIMICIDTSRWMLGDNSYMFRQQADAIRLYCSKKIESHKDTVLGTCGMSEKCTYRLVEPNRILSRIMNSLNDAAMGGDLLFVKGVMKAHAVWFGCRNKELGNHLPKRIAVFAGGPVFIKEGQVQILGKAMRDRNVACDVISFGDPAINKQQLFETLIHGANNNGNCNLVCVPPNSTVHDALLRSRIILHGSALFASFPVQQESSKHNIMASASSSYSVADTRSRLRSHVGQSLPLASSVHQESSMPHKKAAASYPEILDLRDHPAKINALSESVVEMKLENVKPNSQPEALDQRIEWLQRELDSMIKLKNKQVA